MGRRTIGLAQIIVRARQLRSGGLTYRAIAAMLGVSHHLVIYWTNEVDRERQMTNARERNRRRRERKPSPPVLRAPARRANLEAASDDNRTLTGRIMGDPPSGRSALARELDRPGRPFSSLADGENA